MYKWYLALWPNSSWPTGHTMAAAGHDPGTLGREADCGASGGITGGLAAFPGAAVAVWCGLKRWPKENQRSVTQTYILIMQVAALVVKA